jgi:predicted transcriptional regulator
MAGREKQVSDNELLAAVALSSDPVVSTGEVADFFGMTTQGIGNRLRKLNDEELLRTKKAGNARIWWISEIGLEHLQRSYFSDISSGSM